MLVYAPEVYERETAIRHIFADAHLLPYWRLGLIYTADRNLGVNSAGPYRIVVACADVKLAGPFADFPRRVAYLNVGGAPDHMDGIDEDTQSDNLLLPPSFVAGEPFTIEPTKFGLSVGGPEGLVLNHWRDRICGSKSGWDAQSRTLGLSPLLTSTEKWGLMYDT